MTTMTTTNRAGGLHRSSPAVGVRRITTRRDRHSWMRVGVIRSHSKVIGKDQEPFWMWLRGVVTTTSQRREKGRTAVLIVLLFLLVLILAGVGVDVHFLWILAVIFAIFWLIGVALGRGEGAGAHRFYRW